MSKSFSPRERSAAFTSSGDLGGAVRSPEPDLARLHRALGNRVVRALVGGGAEFGPAERAPSGGRGAPIPGALRADLERQFGRPFDDVKLHEDGLPEARGVEALTVGKNVHVARGRSGDRALLRHELTHVVQQSDATPIGADAAAPRLSDVAMEREANRVERAAAAGHSVAGMIHGRVSGAAPMQMKEPEGAEDRADAEADPYARVDVDSLLESHAASDVPKIFLPSGGRTLTLYYYLPPEGEPREIQEGEVGQELRKAGGLSSQTVHLPTYYDRQSRFTVKPILNALPDGGTLLREIWLVLPKQDDAKKAERALQVVKMVDAGLGTPDFATLAGTTQQIGTAFGRSFLSQRGLLARRAGTSPNQGFFARGWLGRFAALRNRLTSRATSRASDPAKQGDAAPRAGAPGKSSPLPLEISGLDPAEVAIVEANLRFKKSFTSVATNESVGGNAGKLGYAVNGVVDRTGRIVVLGNIQHFSQEVRSRLDSKEYIHFTFHTKLRRDPVKIIAVESRKVLSSSSLPPNILRILQATADNLDRVF